MTIGKEWVGQYGLDADTLYYNGYYLAHKTAKRIVGSVQVFKPSSENSEHHRGTLIFR
jgi:hypothetical protein